MIRITHRGDFTKTERFLRRTQNKNYRPILERYARSGVDLLESATPRATGLTAGSWSYEIVITGAGFIIFWKNRNIVNGVPIVILLQYGHGTRGGTYVVGRDFINPPMRVIFDGLTEDLWKEVTSL